MNGTGVFFLVVFILLIAGVAGWVGFTQLRARRLGLPPPTWKDYVPFIGSSEPSPYDPPRPRRDGALGWIQDRITGLRQKRSRPTAGAYEQGRDQDDAWDARVPGDHGYGSSGYYNESELEEGRGRPAPAQTVGGAVGGGGPHAPGNPYGGAADTGSYSGSGYHMNIPRPADDEDEPPRGRSRSRDPNSDNPFGVGAVRKDPFADAAEPSNMGIRGVGVTRPMVDIGAAAAHARKGKNEPTSDSPSDRRSIFKENM